MQYGKTAFGITLSDGTKATTMESISDSSETLGAVSHMNANDLGKINDFYDCSNAPTCKLSYTQVCLQAKLPIEPALTPVSVA